jgi:tetratricopeptide (TPR) repeat protein
MKDRIEAKRLFNQAHLAYKNGDYEEAILKWQQSYELSREALIFESIANAYERLGQSRRALENLREWRKVAPWREHKTLDSRIERLEQRVKDDEAEQRRKDAELQRAKERNTAAQALLSAPAKTEDPSTSRPMSAMRIAGFPILGVGGALTIAGVTLAGIGSASRPDSSTACAASNEGQLCLATERDAIESSNAMALGGDVGWIVGAATAAAGLTLVLASPATTPEASRGELRVRPLATPSCAGLFFSGAF